MATDGELRRRPFFAFPARARHTPERFQLPGLDSNPPANPTNTTSSRPRLDGHVWACPRPRLLLRETRTRDAADVVSSARPRLVPGVCDHAVIPASPGSWAEDADPDWSPGGSRIAFTRLVWLCHSCDQAWSPDGTRLAVERGGIEIIAPDGKTIRVLNPRGSQPAWQPR